MFVLTLDSAKLERVSKGEGLTPLEWVERMLQISYGRKVCAHFDRCDAGRVFYRVDAGRRLYSCQRVCAHC